MKKIIANLKLDQLDKPDAFNLYRFKRYDEQVSDFLTKNQPNPKNFFVLIWGIIIVVFWLIVSIISTSLYLILILGCALASIFKNNKSYKNDPYFERYLDHFYHKPALFYLKLLEGNFFSKIKIESPSLEVGVENGEVSLLHFNGQKIDWGSEYVPENIIGAAEKNIYNNLVCFDIKRGCFRNDTFSTILMVHTVDHFPELEEALKEVYRMLKPGGICALSGLDKNFWDSEPISKILKNIGLKKTANKLINTHRQRLFLHNELTIADFKTIAKNLNFEVTTADSFLKTKIKRLWLVFFLYFECLGATEIFKILKKLNRFPTFLKKILKWSIIRIFYSEYLNDGKSQTEGCHYFFILKKPIPQETNSPPAENPLVCPICRGNLTKSEANWYCDKCQKNYPYLNQKILIMLTK
jgi:SAM-dependent methyltransferase